MSDGKLIFDTQIDNSGIEQGSKDIKSKMKGVENSFLQTGAKASKSIIETGARAQALGNSMQVAGAKATIAGSAMVLAGKKAIASAKVQTSAENKLTEIYKTRMGETKKAAQETMALASKLQNIGIIGDEVALSGSQQLATFLSSAKSVNKLMPAMEDLLAQQKGYNATAEDAVNIGNLMGKVMQGQVGALTRVGITFTEAQAKVLKYGTEEERAAMLAEVITSNVGHMNEKLAQTPEGKIKQATNALGDLEENIGKAILPAVAELAVVFMNKAYPALDKFIQAISQHPKISAFVVAIAAALTAGGAFVTILGTMISGVGSAMVSIGNFGLKFVGLYGHLTKATSAVLKFAAANIKLIASMGIIALLATIAVYLYKTGATAEDVANMITNFAEKAVDMIGKIVTVLPAMIGSIVDAVSSALPGIIDAIVAVFPEIVSCITMIIFALVNMIPTLLPQIIDAITQIFTAVVNAMPTLLPIVIDAIIQLFVALVNQLPVLLPLLINGLVQLITSIAQQLPTLIMAIINALPGVVMAIVSGILACRSAFMTAGVNIIKALWKGIKAAFGGVVKNIKDSGKRLKNALVSGIGNLAHAGRNWIAGLWNGIKSKLSSVISSAKAKAKQIPAAIKKGMGSLYSAGKDLIGGLWNGIKGKFVDMLGKVKGLVNKLPKAVKKVLGIASPSKVMMAIGRYFVDGFTEGIDDREFSVTRKVRSLANNAVTAFRPNSPVVSPFRSGAGSINTTSTVSQTINFNQPVETPAQTARVLRNYSRYGLAAQRA